MRAWNATNATVSALAGSGELSAVRIVSVSTGSGTVTLVSVTGIARIGSTKTSLRPFRMRNNDLSPCSTVWRPGPR